MEFSREEYWSGYPFPSKGDLPDPGIDPNSCALQADSPQLSYQGSPIYIHIYIYIYIYIYVYIYIHIYNIYIYIYDT